MIFQLWKKSIAKDIEIDVFICWLIVTTAERIFYFRNAAHINNVAQQSLHRNRKLG